MSVMTSTQYPELLELTIRKVSMRALEQLDKEDYLSAIVSEGKTEKYTESDLDMGGAPEMPILLDTIAEATIGKGYVKQRTIREIALSYKAKWTLLATDLYGVIKRCSQYLAGAAAHRKQNERKRFFSNGFAAVDAESTGGDGQPLFSANHTVVSGGGLQSNLLTGPITSANIQVGINRMMQFVDDLGNMQNYAPDILVCSQQNQFTAMRELGSMYDPSTANNAINPVFGNYNELTVRKPKTIKVLPVKGLTPVNMWALVDSAAAKEMLRIDWLIPVKFFELQVVPNVHTSYAAFGAFNRGFLGWQFAVGSQG